MIQKSIISLFLLIGLSQTIFSQSSIKKAWIGERLDYWEFSKKKLSFGIFELEDLKSEFKDSILTLTPKHSFLDYFLFSSQIDAERFVFKVWKLTDDSLVVAGLTANAKKLIHNRERYTFSAAPTIFKENFIFQKLSLRVVSGDDEFTKDMDLEIDSAGVVHCLSKTKSGTRLNLSKGQLTSLQLQKLINLLKRSGLDRLPVETISFLHGPTFCFNFQYNNKSHVDAYRSFPYLTRDLFHFILKIPQETALQKTEESYTFSGLHFFDH